MSQLSSTDGHEQPGASSPVAGSVSLTPPPPEPPQLAAQERRSQAARAVTAAPGVVDELGPSLTTAQLMGAPMIDRNLPDLSVSNEALLASLRPAADNDLGTRVARLARTQGESALHWFGTRPSWLQATLSVAGGSLLGLGLVVAYAKTFHAAPPEVTAEPVGPARGVALAVAAAPAALIAQRVVQPLSVAPTAPAAPAAPATAAQQAAADEAPAGGPAVSDEVAANEAAESEAVASEGAESEPPRKSGKRQRVSRSSSASSAKLPAWVQQQVKPQVQRAAAREKKAALREKRAAALREKRAARRARAKARAQE